jgi:hypothetical protein
LIASRLHAWLTGSLAFAACAVAVFLATRAPVHDRKAPPSLPIVRLDGLTSTTGARVCSGLSPSPSVATTAAGPAADR